MLPPWAPSPSAGGKSGWNTAGEKDIYTGLLKAVLDRQEINPLVAKVLSNLLVCNRADTGAIKILMLDLKFTNSELHI